MNLLPGVRKLVVPRVSSHQGGWDEAILFFGVPMVLFVVLRYLGVRRERREAKEAEANPEGTTEDG
jgi:cyanate permease